MREEIERTNTENSGGDNICIADIIHFFIILLFYRKNMRAIPAKLENKAFH